MSKKILKGDQIQMWDYNTGALAYATSHTLTLTGNTEDISTKDHGWWTATSVGSITWELTAECLYTDNDFDALFDKMIRNEKIHLAWGEVKNYDPNGLTTTGGKVQSWVVAPKYYSGYAIITNLNTNANTGENATFSITLTGNGALTKEDDTITDYFIDIALTGGESYDYYNNEKLFNSQYASNVNSIWLCGTRGEEQGLLQQFDADGYIHIVPDMLKQVEDPYIRIFLSSNQILARMFENTTISMGVYVPLNIGRINDFAFSGSMITEITWQYNQMKIGQYAFAGCNFLTDINKTQNMNFINTNSTIGNAAFNECVRLDNVTISDNVFVIPMSCFANCANLSNVVFGSSVHTINEDAFVYQGPSNINFTFNSESAPTLNGSYPLRRPEQINIINLNNSTKTDWLASNNTWTNYADANYNR